MTLFNWSRTAASNSNADATINYAEGQSPSSLNDSARAAMAAVAKYRDDIAGAIATAGTSTAYTLTSYQVFSSLSLMNGQMVAFTPHATNGGTTTLNVDGLGAKALRSAPSVELPSGALIAGTPYVATYYNATSEWILQGGLSNPYNIPLGGSIDYWGSTAPNSSFAFPYGQAISRTTYASLFSLVGTTFGVGDGSTTFNLPDVRGRVIAGRDDMGGSAASRITSTYLGSTPTTLGAVGGTESFSLVTANLPPYTPAGTIAGTFSGSGSGTATNGQTTGGGGGSPQAFTASGGSANPATMPVTVTSVSGSIFATFTGTAQGGTSAGIGRLQPTIIANCIMRII